jgi:hypothetical protein
VRYRAVKKGAASTTQVWLPLWWKASLLKLIGHG